MVKIQCISKTSVQAITIPAIKRTVAFLSFMQCAYQKKQTSCYIFAPLGGLEGGAAGGARAW
jgi:hypothetical protein